MTFSLQVLLEGYAAPDSVEAIAVSGVNADSRKIVEGDVFFALPGTNSHGDAFAAQAVANGALAIVSDRAVVPNPGVSVIVVDDVRAAYAHAAAKASGPQPENIVGITGTSGKTSTVSFVRQIWAHNGLKAASIGTLGIDMGKGVVGGELTTPDSLSLHKSLAELKRGGIDHVAVEASSHGLDQRRLDGVRFKAVGFSNLSHDHLDYHADMDEYREAKLRLFRDLLDEEGQAVVNTDDPEHMPFMFAALDRGAALLTVGTEGAYIEISDVIPEGRGQRVIGKLVGEPLEFVLPLVGRFQVDNALMAAALAMSAGADHKTIEAALEKLEGAPGRLEFVTSHNGADVFVDYAHKPAALEGVLEALRPHASGRLIVVFGCGGDRDKTKRPMMGDIAQRLADVVIVTDDNPRTEDAASIRAQIMAAAPKAENIGDRATAIRSAMSMLEPGDVLVVAGKGHETYQIIGTEKNDFSDSATILDLVEA